MPGLDQTSSPVRAKHENVDVKIDFNYHDKGYSLIAPEGDYIAERVRRDGTFYEIDLLEDISLIGLPENALAFDVGANLGNHTLFFADVMGLELISVEPEAQNARYLRANAESNGISHRVTVFACALGRKGGRARLVQKIPDNSGTFTVIEDDEGAVDVKTLDELAEGREVALIKIDVEGHEVEVLRGAENTLKAHHPVVSTECHSSEQFAAISALLTPLGYSVVDMAGRSDNLVWIHEKSLGAQRARNARDGIELRRQRRKFQQVYAAADRLSNLVRTESATGASWRGKVDEKLSFIAASVAKVSEAGESSDLCVYWKALVDMIGEVRGHTRESDQRFAAIRQELAGANAQFPRELDHLRVTLLRGIERQFGGRSQFDRAVIRLEDLINKGRDRLDQSMGRIERAIGEDRGLIKREHFDDSVGRLLRALAEDRGHWDESLDRLERFLEGEIRQSLGEGSGQIAAVGTSLKELRAAMEKRNAALARRELDTNDLTQKLLSCQEQLKVLTGEVVQAHADRQRLLEASQGAKRSELAQSLAVREWEGAYRVLHGSRALRMARTVRALVGKAQPEHDTSARSAQISDVVARHMRSTGMEREKTSALGLREVTSPRRRGRQPIRAGVATMPGRESGLAVVLDSISRQVDEIYVYLNGFEKVPDCVLAHDNVRAFIGPDVGDRGKFRFIDGYSGYFISIDDDIAYPEFYVQTLVDGIERYGRKAAVGWHGSILLDGFSDYYDPKSRRVLSFGSERGADTQVHVLGTGCVAFHTDTLKISYGDFLKPNMADIFFALEGQRQKVPFMVLAHRKGWATPIEFKNSPSISGESMKSSGSRIDVRTITNSLVKTQGKWEMPELAVPAYTRAALTVALIGRTDKERWKKGGILKSSHLTKKMLDPYGVTTHLIDIEKGDVENLGGVNPQVVMIYPGDPDRPDYTKVEYLVDFHASRGRIVLVNLSLNSMSKRSEFVCRRIAEWRRVHGERVWLMTFTDRAKDLQALAPVADAIFAVPKTIEVPDLRVRSFAETEGIFLGDYGKLCDDGLLGFPAQEAISALRAALPGTSLFAVKQYAPKVSKDLGIRVLPYLSDDYAATLRSVRVMVNLVKYATFEMVPTELAAMGVPIVHPRMSFSLSDYLGLSAFEVETITDLTHTTALLYKDPMAWGAASASSELRGTSADFRFLSGQMYIKLLGLVRRVAAS